MKKLLGLALIFSLVGLLSLVLIAEFSEIPYVTVSELGEIVGQRVIITGNIVKVSQKSQVSFFELEDETGQIRVVAFGKVPKVSSNTKVSVLGKVEIYKGDLEVIANNICLV